MFNYIKNKIDEKIKEKFEDFYWDANLNVAASKAVGQAITRGPWSSIKDRLDKLIEKKIDEAVRKAVYAEITKPKFVKAVVSQLNDMQLNSSDLKS